MRSIWRQFTASSKLRNWMMSFFSPSVAYALWTIFVSCYFYWVGGLEKTSAYFHRLPQEVDQILFVAMLWQIPNLKFPALARVFRSNFLSRPILISHLFYYKTWNSIFLFPFNEFCASRKPQDPAEPQSQERYPPSHWEG